MHLILSSAATIIMLTELMREYDRAAAPIEKVYTDAIGCNAEKCDALIEKSAR